MQNQRRRKLLFITAAVGLALTCLTVYPIATVFTRVLSITMALCLWCLLAALAWRIRATRMLCVTVTLIVAALLVGPGRGVHDPGLARQYANELLSYQGTRYLWGGENRVGTDCSGLVRAALVDAAIVRGVTTVNPSLVRFGASLWWHDRTAREIGAAYRGETTAIAAMESVNAASTPKLRLGDLAVTASGVHVLAYVGDDTWVEADPIANEVLVVRVPEPENPWFKTPVRIVRWRVLADGAP